MLRTNAGRKLSILGRLVKFLFSEKRQTLMKTFFFESQVAPFLLVWMFYCKKTNNRTNHIHQKKLRMGYEDYDLPIPDLLSTICFYTLWKHSITSNWTIQCLIQFMDSKFWIIFLKDKLFCVPSNRSVIFLSKS